jgi:hypothetical protein
MLHRVSDMIFPWETTTIDDGVTTTVSDMLYSITRGNDHLCTHSPQVTDGRGKRHDAFLQPVRAVAPVRESRAEGVCAADWS